MNDLFYAKLSIIVMILQSFPMDNQVRMILIFIVLILVILND